MRTKAQAPQVITAKVLEGTTYYETDFRGVTYLAYITPMNEWCVISRRIALGRNSPGTCRYFDSVSDVSKGIRALAMLPDMIDAGQDQLVYH